MQVTEKSIDGLSREYRVIIPKDHLSSRLDAKLEEVKGQVHLKGFRPGKAPLSFLKKMYGKGMMAELIEEEMKAATQKAVEDNSLRPAMPPAPKLDEDATIEDVIAGQADLEYDLKVEVLPDFDTPDVSTFEFERITSEPDPSEVQDELQKLADSNKAYTAKEDGAAAEDGDQVVIDFLGKIDGEAFDRGSAEGQTLVLGSGSFIPGFEEGLIGAKAGDELVVDVTFPEEYNADDLAGKPASFEVTVHSVSAPEDREIDDALAKDLGFDTLEMLQGRIEEMVKGQYDRQSRLHLKRAILDKLDEDNSFDLPNGMVDAEFEQIWNQVQNAERDEEDADKTEEELKTEYRTIAERRVRLGLVLAEIGKDANVQVPEKDMQQAIQMQAMQAGVPVQQVAQFLQQNPGALAQIRAPLFEDRVIDHIIEKATVTDKAVDKETLMKDPGDDELG